MEGSPDWFLKGLVLFKNKEYDSALAAFDRAIMYNLSPGAAWYNRGLVCMQTGNYDQALHSFDQSLLHCPDNDVVKHARDTVLGLMDKQEKPLGVSNALSTYQPIRITEFPHQDPSALPRIRDSFSNPHLIVFLFIVFVLLVSMGALAFGAGFGVSKASHHTKLVSATAMQTASGVIRVTYQGGDDAAKVNQMIVVITDSEGTSYIHTLGKQGNTTPLLTGSSISMNGRFIGKDHVVATARYMDGSGKEILNVYI